MKILITGVNGFLGYYLVEQLINENYTVIGTGRGVCRLPFTSNNFIYREMDFTDPFAVDAVFREFQPGVVVHAGAMGKPDECEMNQMPAYIVNVEGTVNLLLNAEEQKSFFVFISTDFVFDGERGMYTEEDAPRPVNYYGRTKLDAEEAVKDYPFDWCIIRTVLVYGKNHSGRNDLLTLVKEKLEKGEEYNVVDDQLRTPTHVKDLAKGIVSAITKEATGIFHISGKDILTPYQMALMTAVHLGLDKSLIKKVTALNFSQPARRPLKTGFIIDKARKELGYNPVTFEEGLNETFA